MIYVITFGVLTPLKCNATLRIFVIMRYIDLAFVYQNLLFKVFIDDYCDCNKHITGDYRPF